jgi:hypothetical protein
MAMQLTPPTKNVFYTSIILGAFSIVLYLLGIAGAIGGGFQAVLCVLARRSGIARYDCRSGVQGHLAPEREAID